MERFLSSIRPRQDRYLPSIKTVTAGLFTLLALTLLAGTVAANPQPIDGPTVIDQPGHYVVNQSFTDSGATYFIKIEASDVTLDGDGQTIDGTDTSYRYGVHVHNASRTLTNVTVKNLKLNDWYEAVHFEDVQGSRFTNNTVTSSSYLGMKLNNFDSGKITNNNVSNNDRGISITSYSDGNLIANNTASDNKKSLGTGYGIYLYSSRQNTIRNNTANSNGKDGILLYQYSNQNVIENNTASSNDYNGIRLDWRSSLNTVNNNTVTSSGKKGIYLNSDSDDNTLENNTVTGSGEYGIYLSQANSNTLRSNELNSNTNGELYTTGATSNTITQNLFGTTEASFTYSGDLTVSTAGSPGTPPDGYVDIGKYLAVTKHTAAWLNLTIHYSDGDLGTAGENSLLIWRHDGSWNQITGTNDVRTSSNEVYANASTFGTLVPLGTVNSDPQKASVPDPGDGNTSEPVATTLSTYVQDPDGDALNVTFRWSNGTLIDTQTGVTSGTRTTTPTLNLNYNTTYSWYVNVTDTGGVTNTSPTWSFTTTPDTAPPRITALPTGYETGSWSRPGDTVTLRANATDPETGVKNVTINASPINSSLGTTPMTLTNGTWTTTITTGNTTSGTKTLTITTHDNAENQNQTTNLTVNIDSDTPAITGSTVTYPSEQTAAKQNQNVTITLSATDNQSGIKNTTLDPTPINPSLGTTPMTLSNGNWTATIPIGNVTSGTKTLNVTTHDNAGNSNLTTVTTEVDNNAPDITGSSITYPANQTAAQDGHTITLNVTATDGASGLKNVTINASPINSTGILQLTRLGGIWTTNIVPNTGANTTAQLTITATDNASNTETTTVNVTVDNHPPGITNLQLNLSGSTLHVTTTTDEKLTTLHINLTGPSETLLTSFTETDNGDTTYTYSTNHTATYGTHTATLEHAQDHAGNNGAENQTATTTRTRPPARTGTNGYTRHPPEPVDHPVEQTYRSHPTLILNPGEPGEATFTQDAPIKKIVLTPRRQVRDPSFSTGRLTQTPPTIETPEGEVNGYLSITTSLKDDDIDTIEIQFPIPRNWLTENELTPEDISLTRWSDGKWNHLETRPAQKDDETVLFTAQSPGLSIFAIQGNPDRTFEPTTTTTSTPTEEREKTPTTRTHQSTKNPDSTIPNDPATAPGFGLTSTLATLLSLPLLRRLLQRPER